MISMLKSKLQCWWCELNCNSLEEYKEAARNAYFCTEECQAEATRSYGVEYFILCQL